MRVNVGELLADRHAVRVLPFSEPMAAPSDEVTLAAPVEGELVLSSTGRTVWLRGQVRTVAGLTCGACLSGFEQPIDVPISEEFRRAGGASGPAQEELTSEDFLVPVEPGDSIDVTEIVRQNLILALPIAPRCREECRGLCPRCGADLNRGPCACQGREIDPRLAPLRQWAPGKPRRA